MTWAYIVIVVMIALSAYFSVCGVFAEEVETAQSGADADGAADRKGEPMFFLVSETERVAEYFTELFYNVFGERLSVSRAVKDRLRGRSRLILEYRNDAAGVLEAHILRGKGTRDIFPIQYIITQLCAVSNNKYGFSRFFQFIRKL